MEQIDKDSGYTWDCPLENGMQLTGQAEFDRINFASVDVVFDSNSYAKWFWCDKGGWTTMNSDEKQRQMSLQSQDHTEVT